MLVNSARENLLWAGAASLSVCVALLPLFLMDQSAPGLWSFSARIAPATLALSDSAKQPAAILLVLFLIGVRVTRRDITGALRWKEALICTGALAVFLAGGAAVNEHMLKRAANVPRPNVVLLASLPSFEDPFLERTADAFYELGDKARRRVELERILKKPQVQETLRLTLGVKAHWLDETGHSFPSGHSYAAMFITAFFLALGFGPGRAWRTGLCVALPLWTLLVACSRPLLLVHSASDVLVGTILGALIGCGVGLGTAWLLRRLAGDWAAARDAGRRL